MKRMFSRTLMLGALVTLLAAHDPGPAAADEGGVLTFLLGAPLGCAVHCTFGAPLACAGYDPGWCVAWFGGCMVGCGLSGQ